jgi:hypothetical protein
MIKDYTPTARDNLIRLQNYCIELGRLSAASDAIGYSVYLNQNGETLEDRKNLLKGKIDELRDTLLVVIDKKN